MGFEPTTPTLAGCALNPRGTFDRAVDRPRDMLPHVDVVVERPLSQCPGDENQSSRVESERLFEQNCERTATLYRRSPFCHADAMQIILFCMACFMLRRISPYILNFWRARRDSNS